VGPTGGEPVFYAAFDHDPHARMAGKEIRGSVTASVSYQRGLARDGVIIRKIDYDRRAGLRYPRVNVIEDEGTISFAFKPMWHGNDGKKYELVNYISGRGEICFTKSPNNKLELVFNNRGESKLAIPCKFQQGKLYNIGIVWNVKTQTARIFIDGKSTAGSIKGVKGSYSGGAGTLWIGSKTGDAWNVFSADALFDEFKIFDTALDDEQLRNVNKAAQVEVGARRVIDVGKLSGRGATVQWQQRFPDALKKSVYLYHTRNRGNAIPHAAGRIAGGPLFVSQDRPVTEGTLSFWFRLKDAFAEDKWTDFMDIDFDSHKVTLNYKNTSKRLSVAMTGGDEISLSSRSAAIQPGEWHLFTLAWDRNSCVMYVDCVFQKLARNCKGDWTGIRRITYADALAVADEILVWRRKLPKKHLIALFNSAVEQRAPTMDVDGLETKLWDLSDAQRERTSTRERICLHGMWCLALADEDQLLPPKPAERYYSKAPGRWLSQNYYRVFKSVNGKLAPVDKIGDKKITDYWRGCYTRQVKIPAEFRNKPMLLTIDYVGAPAAKIYINGTLVQTVSHKGRNASGVMERITVDASEFSGCDEIKLDIMLWFRKYRTGRCEEGLSLDYMFLHKLASPIAVKDMVIRTSTRARNVEVDVDVYNLRNTKNRQLTLQAFVYDKQSGRLVKESGKQPFRTSGSDIENVTLKFKWDNAVCWDVDKPHLYRMRTKIYAGSEVIDESLDETFGFREIWYDGGDFYLNGKKLHCFYGSSFHGLFNRQQYLLFREETARHTVKNIRAAGYNMALARIRYGYSARFAPAASPTYVRSLLKAADEVGLYMTLFAPRAQAGQDTALYEQEVRDHVRAFGNHPSLIMHTVSYGGLTHKITMHPAHAADRTYVPSHKIRQRKVALVSEAAFKAADPTRLAYHTSAGNLSYIYCTMHYMSFGVPLQEREDWPARWAATKKCAFFSSEYGFPFCMQFLDFDAPKSFGYSKILLAENAARYFGDDIYREAATPAARVLSSSSHFRKYVDPAKNTLDPVLLKTKKLFTRNHVRAWRGYGVSGHGIFGEEHMAFERSYETYKMPGVKYKSIKEPGLKPDIIHVEHRLTRMDKPNAYMPVLRDALAPVVVWIGGERGNFTNKDHAYFSGEQISKQIVVVNDGRDPITIPCDIGLYGSGNKRIEGLKRNVTVPAGATVKIPVAFTAPRADKRQEYEIVLQAETGKTTEEDRFRLQVFPRAKSAPAARIVGLYDPAGKTRAMLSKAGVKYRPVNSINEIGDLKLIIIGREAIGKGNDAFLAGLEKTQYYRRGIHLLVFEQKECNYANLIFAEENQRYAYIRNRRHPVVAGLDNADFINWRGSSDLIDPYPPPAPGMDRCPHYPFVKWHSGNGGTVATFVIKKPTFGNFHPILECGFDLSHTPLIEFKKDNSTIINCQLDVTGRYGKDPVATVLVNNLLRYFGSLPNRKARYTKTAVLASDKYRDILFKTLGVRGDRLSRIQDLQRYDLLIVGGRPGTAPAKSIGSFAARGGTVLYLADLEDRAPADWMPFETRTKESSICKSLTANDSEIIAGLGNSDFYFRDPKKVMQFEIGGAERPLDEGILCVKKHGKGRFVLVGIDPDSFTPEPVDRKGKERYRSFIDTYVHAKAYRILSVVLANCGVQLKMPAFFGNRAYMNGWKKGGRKYITLADGWKFNYDPNDKGLTRKWEQPGYNDSGWKPITTKDYWEKQGFNQKNPNMKQTGTWAQDKYHYDGYAWYRCSFRIPSKYKGKKLVLKLGPVVDYDWTYLNGELIGHIGKETRQWWKAKRDYELPERAIVYDKTNVLAVKVFDLHAFGGLRTYPVRIEVLGKDELAQEASLYIEDLPKYDVNAHHMW